MSPSSWSENEHNVEPHGQVRGTIKHPTMWGDIPPTHTRKHSRWGPRPRPWPDGGVERQMSNVEWASNAIVNRHSSIVIV